MQWLTFNRIYAAMVALAAVSALAVPKAVSDQTRAQVQAVFWPVSRPVRVMADAVYARWNTETPETGGKTYQQVATENQTLRVEVAHLTEQLRKLQQINADREAIGSLREFCRPVRVTGADSSLRRSLSLGGPVDGLNAGMPVIFAGGLVGKLDRVGWTGGASVQLISDGAYRLTARFGRFVEQDGKTSFVPLDENHELFEGDGQRGMIARNVKSKGIEEAGLKVGDWAVVADEDYPAALQGYRIGVVDAIRPARSPGFSEVIIKPAGDPQALREVMVFVR